MKKLETDELNLSEDEFRLASFEHCLASKRGNGVNKSIIAHVQMYSNKVQYFVLSNKRTVKIVDNVIDAIEIYNKC